MTVTKPTALASIFVLIAAGLICSLSASPLAAQDTPAGTTRPADAAPRPADSTPPNGADTVINVTVEGNKTLSNAAVLAYAKTRVGQTYDEALLRADEQRMLKSGYFRSVSAVVNRTEKGVGITFVVTEQPKVAAITITGNKALKTDKLLRDLPIDVGSAANEINVELARKAILNKYLDDGYYFASVTLDKAALPSIAFKIAEGPKVTVRKIRFEGNTFFSGLKLKMTVNSQTRLWPFIKGVLDDKKIEEDIASLRKLYVEEGFLDADVSALKVFSDDKRKVTITFQIHQGERYRVNQVLFRGNTVFADEELRKRLSLAQGSFFRHEVLQRDLKGVQNAYGELGFIEARVDVRRQFLDPAGPPPEWTGGARHALVNVVYQIVEKDQYTIGKIDIRGNHTTQGRIIRRELRFFPEQLFNTVAIEESRKRLLETRLFDEVTIAPVGKEPGVRDALVQVKEGKTAQFMIGVGVSTNSGLLGTINFTQRNFDIRGWPNRDRRVPAFKGAGQTLSITAEPGTEMMRFHIDWTEPALGDGPYSLSTRTYLFTRQRESYQESRFGELVSLGRRFPNTWYTELAQRVEGVNIGDLDRDAPPEVRDVEGTHLLLSTKGSLVRDRTDSRFMPTTGDRLRLSYEQFYGSFNFGKAEADYHVYRRLHTDALDRPHVLAGRLGLGQVIGDAPVFERYYGGGLGSIRGFRYRGISPRSRGTDEPIGGDFMFLAGSEYSYPLIGQVIRGVFFIDTGTVEETTGFTTYRAAAGLGFRVHIPQMGPVPMSFDFGFPLMKEEEDDTQVFSFSVGWTF